MKQIWTLLCVALLVAPAAVEAAPVVQTSLFGDAPAQVIRAGYVPKKDQQRRDDNNSGSNRRKNDDNRRNDDAPQQRPQRDPNPNRDGERRQAPVRDSRINNAMNIASSRGRVLDAGPQGGSIFWVRVATDHGRVDLLVDTDSGRIIGER